MLNYFSQLLVVSKTIDLVLLLFGLLLEILDLFFGHGFLLAELFIEMLVFAASVLFEVSPLVLQFIYLLAKTFLVKAVSLAVFECISEPPGQIGELVVLLVHHLPVLLA